MDEPSPQELFQAYPHIKHAISWVELVFCEPTKGDPITNWQMMVAAEPPWGIEEVLQLIKETVIEEGEPLLTPAAKLLARAEMEHQEFRQYIMGKMGMM